MIKIKEIPIKNKILSSKISKNKTKLFTLYEGPGTYLKNLQRIKSILFSPATTSESISIYHDNFKELRNKKLISNGWLQLGYIVRTKEGVFSNPPEKEGKIITNESILKSLFKNSDKVNGIYLSNNGLGFAPYQTFNQGVQSSREFVSGGLARLLEHSNKNKAIKLKSILDKEAYNIVNVWNFIKKEKPVKRIVGIYSEKKLREPIIYICGDYWEEIRYGYTFGVSKRSSKN